MGSLTECEIRVYGLHTKPVFNKKGVHIRESYMLFEVGQPVPEGTEHLVLGYVVYGFDVKNQIACTRTRFCLPAWFDDKEAIAVMNTIVKELLQRHPEHKSFTFIY